MARRADPERIHDARREANLTRLVGQDGEFPDRARALIARWEAIADAEGRPHDQAFWQAGRDWIAAQRESGARP